MIKIREVENGVIIHVRILPFSSKEGVIGVYAGQLKIAVNAPPERGKANKAITKVLAKWLNIRSSDIQIVSGGHSKDKQIFVRNIKENDICRLI